MADDDLQQRFDALSVPEFRRRIDSAIEYVREIRREIAVHAGMTLEQVPGPIPELDNERAERAFQEIAEMLPLLREPLPPEERAKMRPFDPRQREQMKAALETMTEDPAAFDDAAQELGLDVSSEQLIDIRDGMAKVDMLGELQEEVQAFQTELLAYRRRQVEMAEALRDGIIARRREQN
jgi:hypothetical protein